MFVWLRDIKHCIKWCRIVWWYSDKRLMSTVNIVLTTEDVCMTPCYTQGKYIHNNIIISTIINHPKQIIWCRQSKLCWLYHAWVYKRHWNTTCGSCWFRHAALLPATITYHDVMNLGSKNLEQQSLPLTGWRSHKIVHLKPEGVPNYFDLWHDLKIP